MSLHFERLNSEFKRVLSEAIRDLKDPRLSSMIAIMDAELTKDLKFAKIKVSVYETEEEKRKQSILILNQAGGALAHRVNQEIKMRRVPKMHFVLDESIAYSAHISKLLDDLQLDQHKEEETITEINIGREENA